MAIINTGAGQAIFLGTFADIDSNESGASSGQIDNSNPALLSGGGTGANLVGYTLTGAALDTAIVSTNGQLDDVNNDGDIDSEGASGDLIFGSTGDIALVVEVRLVDGDGNVTNTAIVGFQNTAGELYLVDLADRLGGDLRSVEVTSFRDAGAIAANSDFQSGGLYYADDLNAVCFAAGTLIQTQHGSKQVETLSVGDNVPTLDHGVQTIRWIGRRRFDHTDLRRNPKLLPIRIVAGALGHGLPRHDLSVSRQHRMLVSSNIARRMFGKTMVLIPAIKLLGLPGIFIDDHATGVEYFHLGFDSHEVIFANGAPAESFFPGPQAINALDHDARVELFTVFPELSHVGATPVPAHPIPEQVQQRSLVARHIKNNQPLLQTFSHHNCAGTQTVMLA